MVYEYNNLKIIDSDGEEDDFFEIYNLLVLEDNFEIISKENEEEIDIQAIEELDEYKVDAKISYSTEWSDAEQVLVEQQNKLLQAIKQLDKKIK